ncbi:MULTISPECIES: response regulator [unclassified Cupriavidus]|uniref:response regulator n=1 Tax=unclassified Cupriavidus TaxID=2640874 RepID=UPI0010F823F9|nr:MULTISPECIES: response regulator [unclassified Cupriavidus]MWL89413.1 response regulator [Cupriavidus sp. SW-Y-13]
MDARPSILIVDDHINIRDPLATYFRRFEFEVETVGDGKAMRQRLEERSFSLIVLDIMLPGEDGLSLCRFVSERVGTPVILLTAVAEQADRIAGLEIGASDYVVKPFDPRELVARIRSVLRRNRPAEHRDMALPPAQPEYRFSFGGWTFDTRSRELRNPSDTDVPISTAEFHLLRALVENANRVLSRSQLLNLTQRSDTATFDRSIDSQVSRLRKKLEPDPRRPEMLKTVRGDGYLLTSRVLAEPV